MPKAKGMARIGEGTKKSKKGEAHIPNSLIILTERRN
jgi:hypothetical protein